MILFPFDRNDENIHLIIEAIDSEARMFAVPYIYVSDLEGEPFKLPLKKNGEKWICPLIDKPIFINVLWEVKGFGKLILTADNGGVGYKREPGQKTSVAILLNYELAKSHFKRVYDRYKGFVKEGYVYSSELERLLSEAHIFLEEAGKAADKVTRALLSDKSLNYSLWAGEKLALETAKQNIEKYRKANVTLKITDKSGKPLENARIIVRQVAHDIMFACNTRGFEIRNSINFDEYLRRFRELFNAGIVHFFWPTFEPEEGKYRWETRDDAVNWLKSNGLRIWGHLLIWLHKWNIPEWVKRKNYEELKDIIKRLCHEPASRYRDIIYLWNVFNEPEWGNALQLSVDQQIELLQIGLEAVKNANPQAIRMINLTIVWGEYAAWGLTAEGPAERELMTPFQFLKEAEKRGIQYEAVGLQLYMGFGGTGTGFSVRDMFTIAELLEKYSKIGKELHITELGVPSRFEDTDKFVFFKVVTEAGYWHEPWNEKVQADWVEQFYTIAFGNPNVKSISWFDLADYKNVFVPWGGLLKEDMSPKQSYYRLKSLLESWTTSEEGFTDKNGEYKFRGFKGQYKIEIRRGEKIAKLDLYIRGDTEISVILAEPSFP